jgi:two-component system sensor histidine kinase/response regulator
LRTIESAASHAYKLVENLLIWAQNQTGGREFNPEILNIKMLISEVVSLNESAASNKDIQIIVKIKKAYTIFADKNMIDLVLRNLISIALKFSYKGGKIKIKASDIDNELLVSVSDLGVGIDSEKLSAIFEIDKHTCTIGTENEQGTGLGLILCKDFIVKHKGRIWAESSLEGGSTFKFTLPLI